tara:strand:- start:859 stop:1236 length:378 start_codon:yes stop_codon:yes gene_type:complete
MPVPALLAGPALAAASRYIIKHGVKKAIKKYGDDSVKYVRQTKAFKNYESSKVNPGANNMYGKNVARKGDPVKGKQSGEYTTKGMPKASAKQGNLNPPKPGERLNFAKGGQPSYKNGDMPKAKPC